METDYVTDVKTEALEEIQFLLDYVDENYGRVYAERVASRIRLAINSLTDNPTRHQRVRRLAKTKPEYRRMLVGASHRVIFTVNEDARVVKVVRFDLQSSDPRSLDNLP